MAITKMFGQNRMEVQTMRNKFDADEEFEQKINPEMCGWIIKTEI